MSTSIQIGEIGQIALTVGNLERAKEFYGSVLGLPFLFDAGKMAFFQCGAVRLMVGLREQGAEGDRGTILYFRTADLTSTHRALVERGVAFTDAPHHVARMPDHELWMAFFRDPDGNPLALMSEVRP